MDNLENENLSKNLSSETLGDEILDATTDTRNLVDEYKGLPNEEVKDRLAEKRNSLEIAIENVDHDFNAGTIVR